MSSSTTPPGVNAKPELWSQWSHDLHRLVDMVQHEMTLPGQATTVLSTIPLAVENHEIGLEASRPLSGR
jgi:hypothetical protein